MRSGELNISKEGNEQLIRLIRINEKIESNIQRGILMTYGLNANEIVKYIAKYEGIPIEWIKQNTGLAKAAVQCSADSFVVNQTLVFQIKFCGESHALRVAAKLCRQAY